MIIIPDRYWVGVDTNWHSNANWSLTSGGAGGAGIPTSSDDVFIDGNGHALCWATTPIECNNFTILSAATEMNMFDQGGIIHGDFEMQAGYFAPTGGGGYILEFKGNWLNTGGQFSVGTGTGIDPTVEFSGIEKTYELNQATSASFQNVLVSGEYTFTGTRLGIMNISQKLSITGIMEIVANGTLICDVDLSGANAGFDVFTGELKGTGRLWYRYKSTSSTPITGTVTIRYWRFYLEDSTCNIQPRTYESPCEVEFDYNLSGQTVVFESTNRHYFYKLTILCDLNPCSGTLDFATNNAEIWVNDKLDIYKDAFPNGTFTLNLGDGTHVLRGTVDFYFAYSSTTSHLVVNAANGTLLLYPSGLKQLILP